MNTQTPPAGEPAISGQDGGRFHWGRFVPFIGLLVFSAALWAIHREIVHFDFKDFVHYISALPPARIALACGGTLFGYFALMSYDFFGFRYVKHSLAPHRIAITAFVSSALSMNIGQALLSGGAVRMRLHTSFGVRAGDITRIIGFNFLVGACGQLFTGGLAFVFSGVAIPESIPFPFHTLRWLGIVMLAALALILGVMFLKREAITIRKHRIEIPNARLAIPAILVSALDWTANAAVLYILMPPQLGVSPLLFLGIVMAAHVFAGISMVPGGLGVFEMVILHCLPNTNSQPEILSALIAFRAIYYLFPFLVATLLLGGFEISNRRKTIS